MSLTVIEACLLGKQKDPGRSPGGAKQQNKTKTNSLAQGREELLMSYECPPWDYRDKSIQRYQALRGRLPAPPQVPETETDDRHHSPLSNPEHITTKSPATTREQLEPQTASTPFNTGWGLNQGFRPSGQEFCHSTFGSQIPISSLFITLTSHRSKMENKEERQE